MRDPDSPLRDEEVDRRFAEIVAGLGVTDPGLGVAGADEDAGDTPGAGDPGTEALRPGSTAADDEAETDPQDAGAAAGGDAGRGEAGEDAADTGWTFDGQAPQDQGSDDRAMPDQAHQDEDRRNQAHGDQARDHAHQDEAGQAPDLESRPIPEGAPAPGDADPAHGRSDAGESRGLGGPAQRPDAEDRARGDVDPRPRVNPPPGITPSSGATAPPGAHRRPTRRPGPPRRLDIPVWRGASDTPFDELSDQVEAEDHYDPPPPRPLPPQEDLHFWGIIVGLVGGPLLLLWLVLADPDVARWWTWLAIGMTIGGFVLLVLRNGDDDHHDGAVV